MEFTTLHPSLWHHYLTSPHSFTPQNHVQWVQTPESHLFSADLPGVRKEEIRVEVEDSRYLIIRTEAAEGESTQPAKSFMRKFRLPGSIHVEDISAGYEDGVLTVTVPRIFVRRRAYIDHADVPDRLDVLARAA